MQGHIHKRVHTCKDGQQTTHWYVVADVEPGLDGRRRQKWHGGFRTRREAEVIRARLVNDLHNHSYVIPARLTLREWVHDSWLPMIQPICTYFLKLGEVSQGQICLFRDPFRDPFCITARSTHPTFGVRTVTS